MTKLLVVALSILLSACTAMQSHDKVATQVGNARRAGGIDQALIQLDATAPSEADKAALLYNLERGELLRLANRYDESTQSLLKADGKVKTWEQSAKNSPDRLIGMAGAAIVSERLKDYEGQDYEKVMLTTVLALNRIAGNDWDNARVDIKRTHEREAVIAEFRAKELQKVEQEAKAKGVEPGGKELNGYPVETFNDPAVLELRNGYQNALSHYLSGFLYEVLNEPGLAAPGYRKAIELRPNSPVLDEGLRGLDQRTSFTQRRGQRMTDVLFIVEAGEAPARKPQSFTIPVPLGHGKVGTATVAYPVIRPSNSPPIDAIVVGGTSLAAQPVVDFNAMARRALRDEMPGLVLRATTRALVKGVVQNAAQKKLGDIGGLLTAGGSILSEQSDDRLWRNLPERVYIARAYLPPGEHKIVIGGRELSQSISVQGQYAIVPLRLYPDTTMLGTLASYGALRETVAVQTPPPEPPVPAAAPAKATQKAGVRPAVTRSVIKPVAAKPATGADAPSTPGASR